jgi:hypothetical protein
MRDTKVLARFFAGLLVVGTLAIGGVAPAQAQLKDSGWNGTVATASSLSSSGTVRPNFDSGWNGT